jgi:ribonuclease P protein component
VPPHGYPVHARVRKRGAFVEIQRDGKKIVGTAVLMFTHPQRATNGGGNRARLGVTVSRKVGGAVVRNRVKRLMREVFRRNPAWFAQGRDYVLVARPAAATLDFGKMSSEIERLCARSAR